MADRASHPTRIDVVSLAKAGGTVAGEFLGHELPRLLETITSLTGPVVWTARGDWKEPVGRDPEIRLLLQVEAQVVQTCQRCLEPLQETLALNPVFRFVRDAELAEQLDESSDEEDVMELPRRLNLVSLIEDELIMSLPLVPRHEHCPRPPAMVYEDPGAERVEDPSQHPHPFAALSVLRGSKP